MKGDICLMSTVEEKLGLSKGFILREEIHTVSLLHEGDEVATFTVHVTPEAIKDAADTHLKDEHGKKD